jgi:protein-L-isoaspartate(D-aspartate) O-methyltransferase
MRKIGMMLVFVFVLLVACQRLTRAPTSTVTISATPTSEMRTPTATPSEMLPSTIEPSTTEPSEVTPTAPVATATPLEPSEEARFAKQREQMVLQTIQRRGVRDENVLHAMRTVLRHLFVPADYVGQAYEDHPLPIGYGQTISQPYIVALMTELLELQQGDQVLEIGTGSGYQAAVLAELPGVEVYTIEIVPELSESADRRLQRLGYADIHRKQGDGYYGWSENAPFDAIIVTAAPDHVPGPLVEQLAIGGCMVIPIGPPGSYQTLWKFVKEPTGNLTAYNMGGVAFVPFTGEGAKWEGAPPQYEAPKP